MAQAGGGQLQGQDKAAASGGNNERMFRELVESMSHVAFTLDDRGRFTYVSPQCEEILGVPPEALVGKAITSVVVPLDRDRLCSKYREVCSGGSYPSDYQVIDKDGKIHTVRAVSRSYTGEDGRPAVAGLISEISNWLTADEALQASREQTRMIITHSRDGIVLVDGRGTILEWNPAMEEITGITRPEAAGMPFWEVQSRMMIPENRELRIHEQSREKFSRIVSGRDAPWLNQSSEYEIERPDQSRRTIEALLFSIPAEQGTLIGAIVRDITERKKDEEALRLVNHKLGLMTRITRHDTNNKISVVLGYLAMAKSKNTSPELKEYFEKIEAAIKGVQAQIAFTKLYQDLGSREPQWQDLREIVSRLPVPPGITLAADTGSIEIYADPMLDRVFSNLLDNSIRHGERATQVRLLAQPDGNNLVIWWEDNGIGVPAAEKGRIFERGYGKHTGYGLFLVREILSLTGITITETGVPGSGACFAISVPPGTFRGSPSLLQAR